MATSLASAPITAVLPAEDIVRAKAFWQDLIGIQLTESPAGLMGQAGEGTRVLIYERERTKAEHTVAGFTVPDVRVAVDELQARGVEFAAYPDMPGVEWDRGVAWFPDGTGAAWFTDPEGNIISIAQM